MADGNGSPPRRAARQQWPQPPDIPLQSMSPPGTRRHADRRQAREHLQAGPWSPGESLHHLEPPPVRNDPTTAQMAANLPGISTYWENPFAATDPYSSFYSSEPPPSSNATQPGAARSKMESPIDPAAFSFALPPDLGASHAPRSDVDPFDQPRTPPFYDDLLQPEYSDHTPLTTQPQPIAGAYGTREPEPPPRDSFVTVRDLENSPGRSRDSRLSDVAAAAARLGNPRHQYYGQSLTPMPDRRSRSPSASGALSRAGSMMRAMSQRVVMISGDDNLVDPQRASRQQSRSRSPSVSAEGRRSRMPSVTAQDDTSYPAQMPSVPSGEKLQEPDAVETPPPPPGLPARPMANPLRGKSLGFFSPENPLRRRLCDILVHPLTEPTILVLIMTQTILLAVEAAPDVFADGRGRSQLWGDSPFDWALLGLFVVFTVEIIGRIIVSGFILNAAEYSTIDRKRGVRAAVSDQYRAIFQPQRTRSVKSANRQAQFAAPAFARSFTTLMHHGPDVPRTIADQQRLQLARRAFLRHGFNRLDFIAVVAFWMSFAVSITGLEGGFHLQVFRMLSCLRILRLLALTNGTALILQSLKKAAPLLVRVAFLIGFFWLLFAIIGVQSFKTSLSRQCVWLDPLDPTNRSASFTNEFGFCGGYLDNRTGESKPWQVTPDRNSFEGMRNGIAAGKGFHCPRGSICLQGKNPFNGTINFDDIFHSIELVFIIMSANTWSDLMYYTIDSDYPPAAFFFGAGIMVMMLWLTNLLIAVITSSFQVIREESKSSAFTVDQDPISKDDDEEDEEEMMHTKRTSTLQKLYEKSRWFWIALIALALLAQGFRTSDMSDRTGRVIDGVELAVTLLLDVEMAVRFAADWRRFHRSWRNLVDLGLAVITTVILVPPIRHSGDPYNWLTVFQSIRTYRLVLAIPVTRKLILLVLGNATGIGNLMLFVFLITFLMAIFAVQLFRGRIPQFNESGELNRISFFSIFNSFLGMYQVLSSENWTDILYTVQSYTAGHATAFVGVIFCIGWFILAFFILVNMFIAVIQENFDVSEDEKRLEQVKAFLQRKELGKASGNMALSSIFKFGKSRRRRDPMDYGPAMMEMLLKDAVVREFLDDQLDPNQDKQAAAAGMQSLGGGGGDGGVQAGDVASGFWSNAWGRVQDLVGNKDPNPFYSNIRLNTNGNEAVDPRQMARDAVSATTARRKAQREYLARHQSYNTTLFLFKPLNPVRRMCQRLVGPGRGSERFDGIAPNKVAWYAFSALIYAAIVAMVVLACVTTPLYQKRYREEHGKDAIHWYVVIDLIFAGIFTVEAVIKVVADGFLWTPNAYYRSSWGIIDGIVLVTLWANVLTLFAYGGAVSRSIGAFKALRALRLLNVSESARDTFHDLIIVGWWKLCGAALVSISLLIPFAIFGLNLFNGKMVSCNDGDDAIVSLQSCFGEFESNPYSDQWPMLAPRVASNPYFSFDDFATSLFTLFQIASQEGWVDVSFAAQAITGVGLQPRDLASQGNAIFFVAFNLLATVFVLTLFISVFMRNYTEQTGVAFLTAEQRSWLELRKLLRQISPSKNSYDESETSWKKWCHKRAIEKKGLWYLANTWVLVFHLLLLVLEYETEPKFWTKSRVFLFLFCILVFAFNIGVRIVGLGWTRFRRSSWDLYSLVVVTGAFVSTVALLISNSTLEAYVQLNKFFLVAIVLLLIPRNDALDQLFKTAAASLTTIGNLLATWLVFFLFFAILMVQAFGLTRFGAEAGTSLNFRTVPNALLLLFKMCVGEGWNAIMEDYGSIEPPLCVENSDFFDSDCGSKEWARALFIAWNLVSMYIFVNLFVSLIYESFSYVYQRSSGLAVVDRDEIRRFKEAWRSVDPAGTGFISKEAFPRLLGELSGVFQMRIYGQDDSVRQILDDARSDKATPRLGAMAPPPRGNVGSSSLEHGLDLQKLADRLSHIDVAKVRERRRRFNIFFEEVMVSADPDRGISFTSVLMILAHYNIISDSKSLRLEEFLRRRARLQRVEEEVRRRVVLGFFDTLYYTRQFKRHLEKKQSGRMTHLPQLDIPDILVDDDDDEPLSPGWSPGVRKRPVGSPNSRMDGPFQEDDGLRSRATSASGSDLAPYGQQAREQQQHPLSVPRLSRTSHQAPSSNQEGSTSALSFEIHDEGARGGGGQGHESVSPAQMRDILDDSVWAESIRRSATIRRSQRQPHRYGDV